MSTVADIASPLMVSRYNFRVPTHEGPVVFNTASGAVLALDGPDAEQLAALLSSPPSNNIHIDEIVPDETLADLRQGGFIVSANTDELELIQTRYWKARHDTPVVLTVTTTMDCNLGCYYCYEERSTDALSFEDVTTIVALAAKRLDGRTGLHVDWYGGEPLMNLAFMEAASTALQNYCRVHRIRYSASVISNGTCWPEDVPAFVASHCLSQVQISFDGLRKNHDRRRHYRAGHKPSHDVSSFDLAVRLVDRLVKSVRTDIRFNIDRGNKSDLLPFVDFARERGWFDGPYPATFQPARLSSYSDRSSFLRRSALSVVEYDALRAAVRAAVGGRFAVDESEAPEGFPHPRSSVCAALAFDSVVIGADRRLYRCGLQVSESHRAIGDLAVSRRSIPLPLFQSNDQSWWDQFDPTIQPRCSRCSFLPICWGGCPKKHLEADTHALLEQGTYWRRNLSRLVAAAVKRTPIAAFEYTQDEQFRMELPYGTL